jgi:hypothetical protein
MFLKQFVRFCCVSMLLFLLINVAASYAYAQSKSPGPAIMVYQGWG